MIISRQQFSKIETYLLGIMLYGIVLVYTYHYFQFASKYEPWTTDEFFYYMEAKAIAAHNIYQTPASLDGNTSYIGDFGFHAVSYAIKDGWLAKLFFHTQDPPLLLINFITCIGLLLLILLFKRFSLNIRLKIALVVATHYVLYTYTLSYMQETIHYFFAVLALMSLYAIFNTPLIHKKHLYYFIIVVVVAISFRYGWFIWGAGLLALATDWKSFIKWSAVAILLMALGIFMIRYIAAPYPYYDMTGDSVVQPGNFSLLNSLAIVWQKFSGNLRLFLTPDPKISTTCMRYLLLFLLLVSLWYSIFKRNRFTIACTLIGWAYFIACMIFYAVYWSYDERALAVLNPLLAFSLIGNNNPIFFYPIIAVQLYLLPGVVKETISRNQYAIQVNAPTSERLSKEASYAKIKDLVKDSKKVVISLNVNFVIHGTPNDFIDFPLVNCNGYPIHYRLHMHGKDLRGTNKPHYFLATHSDPPAIANQLIYSDNWMYLYKVLE